MDNTDFDKAQDSTITEPLVSVPPTPVQSDPAMPAADSNTIGTQEPVVPTPTPTPAPVNPEPVIEPQPTTPTPVVSPSPVEPPAQPEAPVVPPPPAPVSNTDTSN
jgi:hypothetical protein